MCFSSGLGMATWWQSWIISCFGLRIEQDQTVLDVVTCWPTDIIFSRLALCFPVCLKVPQLLALDSDNEMWFDIWQPGTTRTNGHCSCAACFTPFKGNKLTLETRPSSDGVDVRHELLKFHSTYYSSNLMGLCVLGRGKSSWLSSFFFVFSSGCPGGGSVISLS